MAPYAATKAAIANLSASLAQLLGEEGIRVNSVAPGPIWTPLIPSTMPAEKVTSFGDTVPLGHAGQPVELAPLYVLLASDDASYISGARVAVTGGRGPLTTDGTSGVFDTPILSALQWVYLAAVSDEENDDIGFHAKRGSGRSTRTSN